MAERRFWLVKSEPNSYSFADLQSELDQTAEWDGVRNYQARNTMRDDMKVGDGVLFYHSGDNPPTVVGTAIVVREGYPDDTAWDPSSDHPDPKSTPDNPIWYMVDIKSDTAFSRPVTLLRSGQRRVWRRWSWSTDRGSRSSRWPPRSGVSSLTWARRLRLAQRL